MTTEVVSASSKPDSLSALASQINEQHDRAIRHATSALEHARQAGELLEQAKQQIDHGGWLSWLSANCRVSARQAQRYLKVANNWQAITKNDAASHLTIDDAIASTAPSREEKRKSDWLQAIESLPAGRMLFGDFQNGFTIIFRSSRHHEFFHCQSYLLDASGGAEVQETKRPVRAKGVATMMADGRLDRDDFIEVDQDETEEPPYLCDEVWLPAEQDFYCRMRGVQ